MTIISPIVCVLLTSRVHSGFIKIGKRDVSFGPKRGRREWIVISWWPTRRPVGRLNLEPMLMCKCKAASQETVSMDIWQIKMNGQRYPERSLSWWVVSDGSRLNSRTVRERGDCCAVVIGMVWVSGQGGSPGGLFGHFVVFSCSSCPSRDLNAWFVKELFSLSWVDKYHFHRSVLNFKFWFGRAILQKQEDTVIIFCSFLLNTYWRTSYFKMNLHLLILKPCPLHLHDFIKQNIIFLHISIK